MISKKSLNHLCAKTECTGCYACLNKCPKNAISMKIDKDGAIRPVIDKAKCVDCGLCDRVCPVINKVDLKIPMNVYAGYADPDIRINSASGGIATALAMCFIRNGGIVYGASLTHGLAVEHIRVDSPEDISRIQGTKYVHSHLGNAIKMIDKDIKDGKQVLFVGSPCQVAAVKNSISNDKLLFCIDLICHGVPTWKTLLACMRRESKIRDFGNKSISFRDSDGFNIKIYDENKNVLYRGNLKNSYYYNGFMEGYIYRDNCYKCVYAGTKRAGDITLGDFWGLDTSKNFDGNTSEGINVILTNTSKGKELLDLIRSDVDLWKRDLDEAVAGNGQLRHPSVDSINHKVFSVLVRCIPADYAVMLCNIKKTFKLNLRKQIRTNKLYQLILSFFPSMKHRL